MDILYKCKIKFFKVFCVYYAVFTGTKKFLFTFTRKIPKTLSKLAKLQENIINGVDKRTCKHKK